MLSPAVTTASTCTRSWTSRVRSTGTTASAPSGIGAPVMIRLAWPGPTVRVGVRPAVISSTTLSTDLPPPTSAERTA